MSRSRKIEWLIETEQFFRTMLLDALAKQRVRVQEPTELYLTQLLQRTISADHFFSRDERGKARQEPLALLLKEATEEEPTESRKAMFQHLGDQSLTRAGLFQDSLRKAAVDIDYYISMGGNAYRSCASLSNAQDVRALFGELADGFGRFVGVLNQVSEKTNPSTESNLIRLLDFWESTRSESAAKKLRAAGIEPEQVIVTSGNTAKKPDYLN